MQKDLSKIKTIYDVVVSPGDRWVYSAGFNVSDIEKNTSRIDIELQDIMHLSKMGARVIILSHQGSYRDKSSKHLDFIARYLSIKLGMKVAYFPENHSESAIKKSYDMKNSEVVLFGNTRFHEGEENGDKKLSSTFAKLGDFVAIGGFCKSHREHASNYIIMDYLKAYLTKGFLSELNLLDKIINQTDKHFSCRIAFIGGTKKEKITNGFRVFSHIYDYLIPGGVILNHILKAKNFEIGSSYLGDDPEYIHKSILDTLSKNSKAKLILPERLILSEICNDKKNKKIISVPIGEPIPDKFRIVDFILSKQVNAIFEENRNKKVFVLVSGTPSVVKEGFSNSVNSIIQILSKSNVKPFLFGGDTVTDLQFKCDFSTGGGAALLYIFKRTNPILEKIYENQLLYQ